MRIPYISIMAAGALALGGCAYGDFGYGLGYGGYYGDYGYGSPYYGLGYGSPYYGYGLGYEPFGWYDNFYYPGTGIYVYDSNRHRHRWSGDQERYWSSRRTQWQSHSGTSVRGENWSGFDRHRDYDGDRHHDHDGDRHHP
jgi:hypothetical protein